MVETVGLALIAFDGVVETVGLALIAFGKDPALEQDVQRRQAGHLLNAGHATEAVEGKGLSQHSPGRG